MTNPYSPDNDDSTRPEEGNGAAPESSGLPSYESNASSYPGANYNGAGYQDATYEGALTDPAQQVGRKSLMALFTLIFGVISLLSMFFGVGILLGFITFILAIIAFIRNRSKAPAYRRTWMTVTGLVLAAVAVVGGLLFFGAFVSYFSDCVSLADQDAVNQCVEEKLQG